MIVLVLSAVPDGLRGHVTRWLLEISPGVFVGTLNARVRERLWKKVTETMGKGRAIMVHRARNEQGLSFLTWGDPWVPTDFEGLTLMIRPGVVGEGIYQIPEDSADTDSPVVDALGSRSPGRRRWGMSDFEKRRRARRGFPRSDSAGE